MEHIFNSLKDYICPIMISKSSRVVGEKEENVEKASKSIIASLLGVMAKNGATPQVKNILDEASNLNIMADSDNICQERPTEEQRKISDSFLQELLGDKAAQFSNPIAAQTGISKVATNRLVYMVAPLVAGYLGNLLQKDNRNLSLLLQQIREESNSFVSLIPSDLMRTFGLASALNTTANTNKATSTTTTTEKSKGNSWLIWLILIALILLLFFWWRSCSSNDTRMTHNEMAARDTISNTVNPAARSAVATTTAVATSESGNEADRMNRMNRDTAHLRLPNNQTITVYKGGMEEEMVNYLNSNDYRNASADDLKNKWFQFDNIAFEFNSADQFMNDSRAQLNNIIAILKSYPNAKIRIAGFADKRGSEAANMEISKQRAQTIERMLDDANVGAQVVRTEGFGDEYATRSANAPDSERAKDRDIALRFVK